MRNDASISVIIRTFDRNQFLREALESLVHQSRQDFEVVVVDMNRSSATEVLHSFQQTLPRLIHLQVGKLLNGPSATNLGIRHANSDKIALLDDDNLYDPTHLEVLVDGLQRTGADLIYTGVRSTTYTPKGELVDLKQRCDPFDFNRLLGGNYIYVVATAFWKATWERLGGFDPRFPIWDDWEFLLRAGATGRIQFLPSVTSESRSFTGQPGIQNHVFRERRHTGRVMAGIHWLHKDLYSEAQRQEALALRLAAKASMTGRSPEDGRISRLLLRARITGDLVAWWCGYSLPYKLRRLVANGQ